MINNSFICTAVKGFLLIVNVILTMSCASGQLYTKPSLKHNNIALSLGTIIDSIINDPAYNAYAQTLICKFDTVRVAEELSVDDLDAPRVYPKDGPYLNFSMNYINFVLEGINFKRKQPCDSTTVLVLRMISSNEQGAHVFALLQTPKRSNVLLGHFEYYSDRDKWYDTTTFYWGF